jgi:hypothetical protein
MRGGCAHLSVLFYIQENFRFRVGLMIGLSHTENKLQKQEADTGHLTPGAVLFVKLHLVSQTILGMAD